MAGEDELTCAASSITRLMQTSKTAMTNGSTPEDSNNSNPGNNDCETKKVPVRYWKRDAAYYGGERGRGGGVEKKKTVKEKAIFSLRCDCDERRAGRLIS